MVSADEAARTASVYPGVRRDLRRKYKLDWDGWESRRDHRPNARRHDPLARLSRGRCREVFEHNRIRPDRFLACGRSTSSSGGCFPDVERRVWLAGGSGRWSSGKDPGRAPRRSGPTPSFGHRSPTHAGCLALDAGTASGARKSSPAIGTSSIDGRRERRVRELLASAGRGQDEHRHVRHVEQQLRSRSMQPLPVTTICAGWRGRPSARRSATSSGCQTEKNVSSPSAVFAPASTASAATRDSPS